MKKSISRALSVFAVTLCLNFHLLGVPTPPSTPDRSGVPAAPTTPLHAIQPAAAPADSPKTPAHKIIPTGFVVKVTPGIRTKEYDFNIPWPTRLRNDGGNIIVTHDAQEAINEYLKASNVPGTSVIPCPLDMHSRIPTRFSDRLQAKVAKDRTYGATHETPAKEDLDHALTPEIILSAILCGKGKAFETIYQDKLTIIIPVDCIYQNIRRQSHLNHDGVLVLSFGLSKKRKFRKVYTDLFHACVHKLSSPKLHSDLALLRPANIRLNYDTKYNILYLN